MKQISRIIFQISFLPLFLTAAFLRADGQSLLPKTPENLSVASNAIDEKSKTIPASNQPNNYTRPTADKRFKRYLNNTVGPFALLGIGVVSAFEQARNRPPEWGKTGAGFARRLGSNFGENAIKETVTYGLEEAFKLDGHFYSSQKRDFGSRLSNGLLTTFTGRTSSGKRVFNPSRIVGTYAGSLVAVNAWYPKRFNSQDGFRRGSQSLAFSVGLNLLNEFLFKR